MTDPIEFYFDFSSPYGYLASTQIDAIGKQFNRAVSWRPYLVGTAMKTTGHQPLANTPMISDYVFIDVPRFARLLGVPVCLPANFPVAATTASRAFYWLDEQDADRARAFARAVYHAYFGEGRDITKSEVLSSVAASLGIEAADMLAAAQSQAAKEKFRARNEAALGKGVFGSPFIVVDGEPFWGADRLDQVRRWLETGGW